MMDGDSGVAELRQVAQFIQVPSAQFDDVLPMDVATALRREFVGSVFYGKDKVGPDHYQSGENEKALPQPGEAYSSSYGRNNPLEDSQMVRGIVGKYVQPIVEGYMKAKYRKMALRAYKLDAGGHFRVHSDHEQGDAAFVLYLSEEWRWDWGGLLMTVEYGQARAFLPVFNSMVVMDAKSKVPHFVTRVETWAKEARYMLAGFFR